MGSQKTLKITNARENNLKNVSLEIPHDSFSVITGLSGSGKSSLAFDTVYAEGQRRYIETFSPYTRQFFDKVKKPDVDTIENVRPAIAIQQRTRVTGSRSTVGSMTNVNEYIKILWSNLATPVCPICGIKLRAWDAKSLAKHIQNLFELKSSTTILICGTISVPDKRALIVEEIKELQEKGFSRFLEHKERTIKSLDDFDESALGDDRSLYVVIDRVRAQSFQAKRVRESIEQAFSLSKGACCLVEWEESPGFRPFLRVMNTPEQENFHPLPFKSSFFFNHYRCEGGPLKIANPRPALFSFNSPLGACPECKGFGNILAIDPKLCVPNENLSIQDKALQCWSGDAARGERKRLLKFCEKQAIPIDIPWRNLSEKHKELIFTYKARDFMGVIPWFRYIEKKIYKLHVRVFLSRYRSQKPCPVCNGTRFKQDSLAYQIEGKNISEIFDMPIKELLSWLLELKEKLKRQDNLPRQLNDVFNSVVSQLEYLNALGLPYLTLNRQARTLSGGETQRVNLATALGSDLISTHFVLDEPSVGLHPRDTARLIESVRKLQARGNSVLVVEHDPDCILSADHIIEVGPEAGEKGGQIVFSGERTKWQPEKLDFDDISKIKLLFKQTKQTTRVLEIKNASARNIKCLDLTIPLESFVCLSGVSGSGKSTLVTEILLKAYEAYKKGDLFDSKCQIRGFEHLEQLLLIDQSPLAKSPRANIATYSGIWDIIRTQLSQTDDAIARALPKSSFSFNTGAGRCPACNGAGFIREDMQFLSDVYIPCELCLGKRFQQSVLEVTLRGKNVDEILRMSVKAASLFFHSDQRISRPLELLCLLGLDHLSLGHPLSELSGGEAQRLKLIPFIDKSAAGKSLLIFDEPSTGLHIKDIERLLELFSELKSRGHSILCIEHNLSLLSCADWLIDLGPEGGE
ncbi:MAG: excinuclease ABC subunit UvrA, partial [SAR324 cluster bacterium]|nr:excinuclease ABC subunit UvrA [SAR324 cluster bacterium]